MKITKLTRFLLIALAAMMVFSLFACAETPAENETTTEENKTPIESTGEKDPDGDTESDPIGDTETTESKTPETTESETVIETETTEPVCQHAELETLAAVAPTCEETGLTEGKKCVACGTVTVAQETVDALGHAWDEGKITTEPDCNNAGVKTFTCANDATHTKTEAVDPKEHTPVVDEAVAPTCDKTGLTEGSHCSVCSATIVAQETVAAKGHTPGSPDKNDHCNVKCTDCDALLKEKKHTASAPDTANDCNVSCSVCGDLIAASKHTLGDPDPEDNCNVKCTGCGKLLQNNKHSEYTEDFTDNGNVRTYTNACKNCGDVKYTYDIELNEGKPEVILSPGTLKIHCERTAGDKFERYELSEDGKYLSIVGKDDGTSADASFMLYAPDPNKLEVSGQYLLIKYRTNSTLPWEIFASAGHGHTGAVAGESFYVDSGISAADNGCFVADGEWRYLIIDLAALLGDKFAAETEGENAGKYACTYIRWDVMNDASTDERYVDIAYAMLAEDLSDLVGIDDMDNYSFVNFKWSSSADRYGISYNATTGNQIFDANCLGTILKKYTGESINVVMNKDAACGGLPFTTITYTGVANKEEIFSTLWTTETNYVTNSGNYIVILYRAEQAVGFQFYLNSANALDPGSCVSFSTGGDDGWRFAVIDISGASAYDSASGLKFARFDYFNDISGQYSTGASIDFGFLAFCDTEAETVALMKHYITKYLADSYSCGHSSVNWDNGYEYGVIGDVAVQLSEDICDICGRQASKNAKCISLINIKNTEKSFSNGNHAITIGTYATNSKFGTAIELNQNADLTISGWGGVEGSTAGMVYKVLDANGNELIGWTNAAGKFEKADAGVQADGGVKTVGCDPAMSYSVTADLSSLVGDSSQKVQVVFAFIHDICTEINEEEPAYAILLTCTNVTVPAKAQ